MRVALETASELDCVSLIAHAWIVWFAGDEEVVASTPCAFVPSLAGPQLLRAPARDEWLGIGRTVTC